MVGGIQTYLLFLGRLCHRLGFVPTLYQVSDLSFRTAVDDIEVVGVPCGSKPYRTHKQHVYSAAVRGLDLQRDLLVFGSDRFVVKGAARSISIQHGVVWDLPSRLLSSRRLWRYEPLGQLMKLNRRRRAIQLFRSCQNRVCVDYNFLNWMRTYLHDELPGACWVIPNFTAVADQTQALSRNWSEGPLKVLFARWFTEYRGTRIIAEVAERILRDRTDVQFTFAGEGPDEGFLRERFANHPSVSFLKYGPDESPQVHLQHHVAVVPSLGSEGTSLSAAEAMGAGAVVIASWVGGLTNMIIDGFNGLLCAPSSREFEAKIAFLANDRASARALSRRSYETAREAFSLAKWEESWEGVLRQVAS